MIVAFDEARKGLACGRGAGLQGFGEGGGGVAGLGCEVGFCELCIISLSASINLKNSLPSQKWYTEVFAECVGNGRF